MEKHKHGGDVYSQSYITDFSANINPLGPPESVKEALQRCAEQIQNYPDVSQRSLRKALAKKEELAEESILFGNGAAELIFAICLGLRPKKALLAVPGFAEYEEALTAAECEILSYELPKEQGYLLNEEYLEQITPELDILFLCNPNNPTGTVIARELLEHIAEKCKECQVLMVVDECFNGFLDEPENYTVKPLLETYSNLIILNAFTKLYAMPGLRLGYAIVTDENLRQKIQRVMQPWSVSIPAQEAGKAALEESLYVSHAKTLIKREREYLSRQLTQFGFQVTPGKANYLFFQGMPGLAEKCREKGYLIRDCKNYRGLEEGFYRIAVRTHEENEGFIEALRGIL